MKAQTLFCDLGLMIYNLGLVDTSEIDASASETSFKDVEVMSNRVNEVMSSADYELSLSPDGGLHRDKIDEIRQICLRR